MPERVVMIGLDACDIELVKTWASEGYLPTFSKLMDSSAGMNITSSTAVLQGSIWPTFFTSVSPAEHGMYYMLQMDNQRQQIKRVKADDLKAEPFWAGIRQDKTSLIVDVPKLGLTESGENVQVVEWAAMDHYSSFQTYPDSLKSQLLSKYGEHILTRDLVEPKSEHEYKNLYAELKRGISAKTDVNLSLHDQYKPDLFVTVYAETHSAGHYLWKFHNDSSSPAPSPFEKNPLLSIYQEMDSSLAKLLEHFAVDQNVFVFSGHGMMEDQYPRFILDEVLQRLGVLVHNNHTVSAFHKTPAAKAKQQSSGLAAVIQSIKNVTNQYLLPTAVQTRLWMRNLQKHVDFSRSKAWALPTDLQGFIRINLQGREPQGVVSPLEYDAVIEQITQCLMSLKNAETGEDIVDKVYKVRELYGHNTHTDLLPDIAVLWHNKPVKSIFSDSIGSIEVGDFSIERSGNHRLKGFCFAYGPSIDTSKQDITIDLQDLGPTALKILGHDNPSLTGKVAEILK